MKLPVVCVNCAVALDLDWLMTVSRIVYLASFFYFPLAKSMDF